MTQENEVANPHGSAASRQIGNSLSVTQQGAIAQRFRSTSPLTASRPHVAFQIQQSRHRAAMRCSGGLGASSLRSCSCLGLVFLVLPVVSAFSHDPARHVSAAGLKGDCWCCGVKQEPHSDTPSSPTCHCFPVVSAPPAPNAPPQPPQPDCVLSHSVRIARGLRSAWRRLVRLLRSCAPYGNASMMTFPPSATWMCTS
jgi:hypothetical protein